MSHPDLDPVDERLMPLMVASGRAVLGAAALEKILLLDIAQRRVTREGFTKELGELMSTLERQPAGTLLRALRELGIGDELASRVEDVIARRNALVHRFLEDPSVVAVYAGADVQPVVDRIDQLAVDCQTIINDIGPNAFSGVEQAFGMTMREVAAAILNIDPATIDDERLRSQITAMQALGLEEFEAVMNGDGPRDPAGW